MAARCLPVPPREAVAVPSLKPDRPGLIIWRAYGGFPSLRGEEGKAAWGVGPVSRLFCRLQAASPWSRFPPPTFQPRLHHVLEALLSISYIQPLFPFGSAGDSLPGLSAYVSTGNVVQSCWCNQATGSASSSSGSSPPEALGVVSGMIPGTPEGTVSSPAPDGAGGEGGCASSDAPGFAESCGHASQGSSGDVSACSCPSPLFHIQEAASGMVGEDRRQSSFWSRTPRMHARMHAWCVGAVRPAIHPCWPTLTRRKGVQGSGSGTTKHPSLFPPTCATCTRSLCFLCFATHLHPLDYTEAPNPFLPMPRPMLLNAQHVTPGSVSPGRGSPSSAPA